MGLFYPYHRFAARLPAALPTPLVAAPIALSLCPNNQNHGAYEQADENCVGK